MIGIVVTIGAAVALGFVFREPLLAAVVDKMTANMFVPSDTDAYDPGLPVGTTFPAIHALYAGRDVTGIGEFMGKRGLAIFVNRSVDW